MKYNNFVLDFAATGHRLINNNRQNTRCNIYKIQGFFVHNNPETEPKRSYAHAPGKEPVLRRMRVTPLGFCLRAYVNEKPLNLEKMINSVLSVLLIIFAPILLFVLIFMVLQFFFYWTINPNFNKIKTFKSHLLWCLRAQLKFKALGLEEHLRTRFKLL